MVRTVTSNVSGACGACAAAAASATAAINGSRLDLTITGANQHAHYVDVAKGTGLPILGTSVAQTPTWTDSVSLNYQRQIVGNVDGFGVTP